MEELMAGESESIADALSRVSGIPRSEMDEIWQQVKVNSERLRSCQRPHDFSEITRQIGSIPREYRCTKCQGTVDSIHRSWYIEGLKDGKNG
jgi:hypothetical protein